MADKLRGYVLHGNKENKLLAWDKKTGKRTVPRKYENLDSPSTAHIGPREVGIAIQEIIDTKYTRETEGTVAEQKARREDPPAPGFTSMDADSYIRGQILRKKKSILLKIQT